ncbi:hypothetical protein [Nonomuraea sediminis]|uniref:hypothetical protein n=1 Tax=Nonomuraea sediminis TaxID=2835864 RepID=UPI001BDC2B32|nr:hypothetical protein [Nonomuraea sediminis]
MRKILGCAGVTAMAASMLLGLSATPAHAMTDCEDKPDGTIITYGYNNDDGSEHIWIFQCYDGGKGRFIDGY